MCEKYYLMKLKIAVLAPMPGGPAWSTATTAVAIWSRPQRAEREGGDCSCALTRR